MIQKNEFAINKTAGAYASKFFKLKCSVLFDLN